MPRTLIALVALGLLSLLLAGPAAAHEEEGSDMPEIASAPSDSVLEHRKIESRWDMFWHPAFSSVPAGQPGCPLYRVTEWDDEGVPTNMDPVFEECATDRMSMYEHAQEADCGASYAKYCVEQLAPTSIMKRGTTFRVYGVLYKHGEPVPSKGFQLQRMVLGRQTSYMPFRSQLTQAIGEIGSVQMPDTARSKVAYRWAIRNDAGRVIHTTMPIVTKVVPTITNIRVNRRSVKRQQLFVARATSNVGIHGVVKLQYRFGDRWIQISRVSLTGQRAIRIPGRINRISGRFPIRLVFTSMTVPGRQWFDAVTVGAGAMTVKSTWTIIRSQR